MRGYSRRHFAGIALSEFLFILIPTSIYWAVITLASVGYGDISPVTPAGRAMTIVLALLGIGIFAIPAALLSSAFSDQLRIEREALQKDMIEMMGDGVISEAERDIIDAEAKRLHLSRDEVDRLLERAKREHEMTAGGGHVAGHGAFALPLLEIAQPPQLVVQCYREMLSRICQLHLAAGEKGLANTAVSEFSRLERDLWERISVEMSRK